MSNKVSSYKRRESTIWLNKVEYTGFLIGSLPSRFAYIYDEDEERDGISSWFNFRGLTYIAKRDLQTGW
jgi:hypothetical protein